MVAYSFQRRFEMPIISLTKLGTIRAIGKRHHAQPGDSLQLYEGMRTKQCRLIARASCVGNDQILITPRKDVVTTAKYGSLAGAFMLDGFAEGDGFADWADMKAFWILTHEQETFTGRWIQWSAESVQVAL